MELKEFIVSAIGSIAEAVVESDAKIKRTGGLVNPGTLQSTGDGRNDFIRPRTTLNFDIAVSASIKGEATAGARAKIWVVEASIDGGKESANETISRLTSSLDVALPSDADQERRIGKLRRPS
ncbi:MAG: hypothetical protein NWP79_10395 [Paracoccaceae bacterium]|nr:hypothetical protein [Paracoccaceae bacterium]